MAWVRFALVYTVPAKRDRVTSRETNRVSKTVFRLQWHIICTVIISTLSNGPVHLTGTLLFFLSVFLFWFCVFLATVGKKSSRMFKATRQLRRQLKQSSLDRQQRQVERRRVTVCSRPSCQAYYCNDFYCFKMSRHTLETQCMKVISFHCEQTEASLRGNRPMVWPFQ